MRRHTPQFPAPSRGFASSDVRLKRDVKLLQTLANGIKLYRYQYRWGDTVYVGVMAHEVASIVPEAVSTDSDGYYRVDYQRLGIAAAHLSGLDEQGTRRAAARAIDGAILSLLSAQIPALMLRSVA